MHKTIQQVTVRIEQRSKVTRTAYLQRMHDLFSQGPVRSSLSCGNLAHGFAACGSGDKQTLKMMNQANIAIVSAYNDMLSAHQPYATYPDQIKAAVRELGSVAQFAGGVPAMCDGVTQGQPGMELSLFSRDVIAMSTAVALSHNMFDGALCLGICDKIVPGMMMGALSFGFLPFVFVPAGPMPSGLPNKEKAAVRQRFAEGKASHDELLEAESASYHSPGTCTFYGTANSNQMLMEVMGLHLPGASFVNPGTPLRDKLTEAAAQQVVKMTAPGGNYRPLCDIVSEKTIVNALVALLATGGSTNHTMHWVAIARAAGIQINWDDFAELSAVVASVARIYPNGDADVNHFHAAGGTAYLIQDFLENGLLHEDVKTILGEGLSAYTNVPSLDMSGGGSKLIWKKCSVASGDESVLRSAKAPFAPEGGLKLMTGNLGRGVMKVSAVKPVHQFVQAPAVVLQDQNELEVRFEAGDLNKDCVVVVRFQGPKANGMPELHKLTPFMGVLQDRGFNVALVTDGRMSGASGKVPAAIHVYPEAINGGPLARVCDGDMIRVDAVNGVLDILVDAAEFSARSEAPFVGHSHHKGMGRELFSAMRHTVTDAESGAVTLII